MNSLNIKKIQTIKFLVSLNIQKWNRIRKDIVCLVKRSRFENLYVNVIR